MAWDPQQQSQQQQNQTYPPPMNMNMNMSGQSQPNMQQQNQSYPQQQQQQQFPMYPPYPLQTQTPQNRQSMNMNSQPSYPINTSPAIYNQNYQIPMQSTYPSPFNNNPQFQSYFGLQPLQPQQIISPFQQQSNIQQLNNPFSPNNNNNNNNNNNMNDNNNMNPNSTQPLPQQFEFNSNNNTNIMSQTQPLYPNYNKNINEFPKQSLQPQQQEEEEKVIENEDDDSMDDGQRKPRLEYSKMAILGPQEPWLLNKKEKINVNIQLIEEKKIFGDLQNVYNEMKQKQNNSVSMDENTKKQNCRLFLDYKAKQKKKGNEEDEKYDEEEQKQSELQQIDKNQPLLVYNHNIRPFYNAFNEYQQYKLLRVPPISSYPSSPPITMTLHIYSILFKDLPQFTVEDYLTQQIIFDYKIYAKYLIDDKSFDSKITLLRRRIDQLLSNKNNNNLQIQIECVSLLDELISIRQKKDALQSEIRHLFIKIYHNWRNLVSWRYNDGVYKFANHSSLISSTSQTTTIYQGTKLMLYLKKIEPNKIQQQIEYNQVIIDELYEIENLIKLRNIINKQQQQQINMNMMEEKFDEETMKQSIIRRKNTYLMAAGSVYYIAYIDTKSCNISQTDLCSTKERFRRRQLSNYSIHANISINNNDGNTKIKCRKITNTDKIYSDFPSYCYKLQFELEMKLLNQPKSIEIELRSNSWFSSKKITNINIPINTQLINDKLIKNEIVFDSDIIIPINRYLTNEDYERYIKPGNGDWNRKICGSISYGMKINITNEYKRKLQKESNAIMTVNVISDKETQENEANEENKKDEEEEEEEKKKMDNSDEIIQNDTMDELLLVSGDNLCTFRHKILKLRQRYAISDDEYIPLFDKDISDDLYKAVHDETKQEIAYRNEIILDRINNATIDVSEVVREYNVDLLPCFSFSIYSLFRPRRRLRPKTSYFPSNSINPEKCKIIIQILQCRNLPIRKTNNMMIQNTMNMNIVQPFIEISFMGNKCRTFTSFGSNARWEQTLYVEFIPPGNKKYTPSNLQKINDDLEINIYDELIISKIDDHRALNSQIQRKEKRYLGSVKIPFTTIYFNKNIEGFFKLNVPLIQLGYTKNTDLYLNEPALISLFATLDPPILNPHQFINGYSNNNNNKYYQWILNNNKYTENIDFYEYCIEWIKSVGNINNNNNRFIEIFASNSRNEPELICRYLRSIEPPMKVTPEIFIRFVSCIPYKEDIHLIPGARDLWMTNIDFLNLGNGDNEEHTNLLCCYFMWYDDQNPNNGWSTYIAMGKSTVSDGNNTMYVLRRNATLKHSGSVSIQNVILYDASKGLSYSMPSKLKSKSNDNLCDISIVYNQQQIYANLQSSDIIPSSELFKWEFENKQFWKPLFINKWKNKWDIYCLPSLQEPVLNYISLSNEYYDRRQNKLEYIIEKQFEEWRDLPTKWNYAISKTLREILSRLEPLCQCGGNIPIINNEDPSIFAINQIYSKIYGFPLNIKDNGCDNLIIENNTNDAVKLIYNTKVHENDDPNAQFARAVYIYPYTNKIASVWIYIASLSRH